VFGISVALGRIPGANVFQIQVGDAVKNISITGN
jgi:hypothetical protein